MSILKRLHSQARARRQGKPAFTLLELIVVLLVLGILAAIAVPTFQRVKENSAVRAAQTTLEAAARNGEAIAASDRDATDEDIAAAVEEEFTDTDVLTVSVSGDTVTVTQTNGSITASGSVEFDGGVATITAATAGSGGSGGGSSSTTSTTVALSLSYASTAFSLSQTSQTLSPTVSGGTASSFSYSGTLPTGVSFDTETGVFTGPSAWNFTAVQVSVGSSHSCAVTTDGEVRCWGSGSSGKLGNGSTADSSTPVTVRTSSSDSSPLTGVAQVVASSSHTCALLESGHVRCWGSGNQARTSGPVSTGCSATTSSSPIAVYESCSPLTLLTNVTFLSAGQEYTCALLGSGQVHCWGYIGSAWSSALVNGKVPTSAADSSPLSGVVHIATGGSNTNQGTFACAVLSSGEVRCWGVNTNGHLGNNSTTASSTPVVVQMSASDSGPLTGATQVVAANNHVCAMLSSGEVRCWGLGSFGRLGNGSTSTRYAPVVVRTSSSDSSPLSGVVALTSYRYHTCAVLSSGEARCWGYGSSGRLGDGFTADRSSPTVVAGSTGGSDALSAVVGIAAGDGSTCAVLSSGQVRCWGSNTAGQLGDGTTTQQNTPVDVYGSGPEVGWPAEVTVTATSSAGATASTNVTLTNS